MLGQDPPPDPATFIGQPARVLTSTNGPRPPVKQRALPTTVARWGPPVSPLFSHPLEPTSPRWHRGPIRQTAIRRARHLCSPPGRTMLPELSSTMLQPPSMITGSSLRSPISTGPARC